MTYPPLQKLYYLAMVLCGEIQLCSERLIGYSYFKWCYRIVNWEIRNWSNRLKSSFGMYVKIHRNAGNGEDPRFSSLCPSEKYLETPLNSCIMGGTRDSGVRIRPTPHTRSTSGVMEREIIYATCALTQIISLLLPCLGISVAQNLNRKLNARWSNLEQLMLIARCDVNWV